MTREIFRAIMADYALEPDSAHGVEHWGRVFDNGTRLAERVGADLELVQLFAVFHDCRRVNECGDPGHGRRGADFAASLRGNLLDLEPSRFDLLHYACLHHTKGWTDGDPTVQVCWDADRLDLPRVGITTDPAFLCTDAGKDPGLIDWADQRARGGHVSPCAKQWHAWARLEGGS